MSKLKQSLKWSGLFISYMVMSGEAIENTTSKGVLKMTELIPPPNVRGMKKLDRNAFSKTIKIPSLKVDSTSIKDVTNTLKKYMLKLRHLKPIRPITEAEEKGHIKEVLLNPKIVKTFSDFQEKDKEKLFEYGINELSFNECPLQLTYDNYTADDVLTAVLPEGEEISSSYSQIGHIVHLNLREHLHDYKHVIGEVLLDKITRARTIVNKVDTIDNTFRVFKMEVLAGDHDFVTEVKENYASFKFDFSTVYWNPRLSTEHKRIVDKLSSGNVLYDVFAGVGPFSIPAAKKKVTVLANDLNPESFKWLQYNAKLNKVADFIKTFNKDGASFIQEDVKQHILQEEGRLKSHIVMNLPATAVTFLSAFKQLFSSDQLRNIRSLPMVHVYCFVKGEGDNKTMAKEMVENELNCSISDVVDEIMFVRNVAPNKDMMRVSFQLTENIILSGKRKLEPLRDEVVLKKIK